MSRVCIFAAAMTTSAIVNGAKVEIFQVSLERSLVLQCITIAGSSGCAASKWTVAGRVMRGDDVFSAVEGAIIVSPLNLITGLRVVGNLPSGVTHARTVS